MSRRSDTARKEGIAGTKLLMPYPSRESGTRLLCDLELHWPFCLLLHNDGPSSNPASVTDVLDTHLHQIAGAKLTVNREIEKSQISEVPYQLQAYPYGPDFSELQWWLLSDKLVLIPGRPLCGSEALLEHE